MKAYEFDWQPFFEVKKLKTAGIFVQSSGKPEELDTVISDFI